MLSAEDRAALEAALDALDDVALEVQRRIDWEAACDASRRRRGKAPPSLAKRWLREYAAWISARPEAQASAWMSTPVQCVLVERKVPVRPTPDDPSGTVSPFPPRGTTR